VAAPGCRDSEHHRQRKRLALTPDLDRLVHAADLATGPKFNQMATAVSTMKMTTKIRALMANLRAVMRGFLSNERAFSFKS